MGKKGKKKQGAQIQGERIGGGPRKQKQSRTEQEPLPPGAIAANREILMAKNPHFNSYSGYPSYYQDYAFDCRDCGKPQVWTASQQKWWYEVAGGSLYTLAIRCRPCRQKRRGN